jgi:uncharacterized protein YecE (DUF72 family)
MKLKNYKHFFAGTSNVVLPVPNKAHFPEAYQDKSRLHYYASLFNTVEINSSFYKVPMARTVAKWAADVPDHFRFTFKLWKGITHAKGLEYQDADVAAFMTAIAPAAGNKGCLLIQFPAGLTAIYFARLQKMLEVIAQHQPPERWPLALEFRHTSWYTDRVYQLLEKYNAALVIHDMPKSSTPLADMETNLVYLRFHGENGRYGGSYEDHFLHEYAGYIKAWLKEGKTVYAYFNNTMGDAVKNLLSLNDM